MFTKILVSLAVIGSLVGVATASTPIAEYEGPTNYAVSGFVGNDVYLFERNLEVGKTYGAFFRAYEGSDDEYPYYLGFNSQKVPASGNLKFAADYGDLTSYKEDLTKVVACLFEPGHYGIPAVNIFGEELCAEYEWNNEYAS